MASLVHLPATPSVTTGRRDSSGARGEFLSVLVPCFNESTTVSELLTRLCGDLPNAQIIVIDDGSTDGTLERVNEIANGTNLLVVTRPKRGGKGTAVREGLTHATREWVAIQDADLEYDPKDLQRLAVAAVDNPGCAIYGSRYLERGKARGGSIVPYLGVKTLALLVRLLYGRRCPILTLATSCSRRKCCSGWRLNQPALNYTRRSPASCLKMGYRFSISQFPIIRALKSAGKKIGFRDFGAQLAATSHAAFVSVRRTANLWEASPTPIHPRGTVKNPKRQVGHPSRTSSPDSRSARCWFSRAG